MTGNWECSPGAIRRCAAPTRPGMPQAVTNAQGIARIRLRDSSPGRSQGRSHHIQLTDSDLAAIERMREASHRGMAMVLADWSPEDLQQLATFFHRLVDDFVTNAEVAVDAGPCVWRSRPRGGGAALALSSCGGGGRWRPAEWTRTDRGFCAARTALGPSAVAADSSNGCHRGSSPQGPIGIG